MKEHGGQCWVWTCGEPGEEMGRAGNLRNESIANEPDISLSRKLQDLRKFGKAIGIGNAGCVFVNKSVEFRPAYKINLEGLGFLITNKPSTL